LRGGAEWGGLGCALAFFASRFLILAITRFAVVTLATSCVTFGILAFSSIHHGPLEIVDSFGFLLGSALTLARKATFRARILEALWLPDKAVAALRLLLGRLKVLY
jgi:hypothetical protein